MVGERQQYAAIFRAEKPHETNTFKDLLAQVAVADDAALLKSFFSELNRAIADAHRSSYSDGRVTWALELIRALILANNEVVLSALRTILVSQKYLPLTVHAFDVMGTLPQLLPAQLLPALAEVVANQKNPISLREKAFETLCTAESPAVLPELLKLCGGESTLLEDFYQKSGVFYKFIQRLASVKGKQAVNIGMTAVMGWVRSIRRVLLDDDYFLFLRHNEISIPNILQQASKLAVKADPPEIEKLTQELSRIIIELLRAPLFEGEDRGIFGTARQHRREVAEQLGREVVETFQSLQQTLGKLLQKVPGSPLHVFVDLLSKEAPLPDWRSDATHFAVPLLAVSEGAEKALGNSIVQRARDYLLLTPDPELLGLSDRVIVHLLQDHLQEVIALGDPAIRAIVEAVRMPSQSSVGQELQQRALQIFKALPSVQTKLEALLLEQDSPFKIRRAVAQTLDELRRAAPSIAHSSRAQVYMSLVLTSLPVNRPFLLGHRPPHADKEDDVNILVEALSDKDLSIRRAAATSCLATTRRNRHWFNEVHCRALLPFLADKDHFLRGTVASIFSRLAPFQHQEIIQGLQEAYKQARGRAERQPPRPRDYPYFLGNDEHFELAAALGITLDALTETRDELGQKVASFGERQRELLQRLEGEAVRIGRDIHDEILGRRCGDLSTAIDEADYHEAQRQLDGLVTDLRRIMNNLSPQDLKTDGLLKTIRTRLDSLKARVLQKGSEFDARFACAPEVTDETIEDLLTDKSHIDQLYRMVLEAMTNSAKHAKGSFISVDIEQLEDGAVEINICDDGCGNGGLFSLGNGIPTMFARAEAIGVTIAFKQTDERGGTNVVIRLDVGDKKANPQGI